MKDESRLSLLPLAPHRRFPLGLSAGLLLLAVTVLLPYALCRQPAWLDEAIFSYMAQGPSVAHLPYYQSGYDNKPPGIFLLYQALGGFDPAGLGRVRPAEGLLVLATCLILLFWLRREVSPVAGWGAAFLYACFLAFTPGCLALTEPPMAALTVAGFCLGYYGLRTESGGLLLAAGLALGGAIGYKQVAVFDLLGLLVVLTLARGRGRGRWVAPGIVVLGCAICGVVVGGAMVATGQGREFWEATVVSLVRGEGAAVSGSRGENLVGFLRWMAPMAWGPALAALPAGLARPPRPLGLLLGGWLAAAALGVASSGYFLNHQTVQIFAPWAALSGLGGAWLLGKVYGRGGGARLVLAGAILLLLFFPQVNKYRVRLQQQEASRQTSGSSTAERLGAWLQATLPPSARLYVLGNGMPVYFYAQRRAPTRYFHSLLLSTPQRQEEALRDLQAHPPSVLVFAPDYYEVQRRFTARVRASLLGQYGRIVKYGPDGVADPAFLEYEVWQWHPHPEHP